MNNNSFPNISKHFYPFLLISISVLIFLSSSVYAANSSASYTLKAGIFSNAGNSSQLSSCKTTTSTGNAFSSKSQTTNYTVKFGGLYLFDSPLAADINVAAEINTDTPKIGITSSGVAKISTLTVKVLVDGLDVTKDCKITDTGIEYTPSKALSDGAHTIDVSFYDTAGNFFKASKNFTVLPGTLVTAKDGGTVVSLDGRVKVIIPPGALLQDTSIRVNCPNIANFKNITPNDYSLSVVADCKPNNTIFYKPVQIIFTLDSAQVPGTPVYLGLYNELENKISLEEFSSFIAADSVTASFSIHHFSTYAAMQGMISSGSPIGASTKTPLPDLFTGSFSHSLSIAAPPGRKGVGPSLALQYRSSNPNSWTGVGWTLNTGYITRQAKKGLPKYDDTKDTFTFVSDSFATELVYLVDNLYQAKIEGAFMKFFKETDGSWRVMAKDGSNIYFGQTADSRETGLNANTFNWYITKAVDNNSNYIAYDYTKDQGKCYLSRVEYTGNYNTNASPKYRIDFSLESRNDTWTSYISGDKITTAKRLKTIEVSFNGDLVWKYELDYAYSADTGRSLLKTFTQYTSDGKAFPTQTFNYQVKQ